MKKVVFYLVLLLSIFVFFACASAPKEPPPPPPPAPAPAPPPPPPPPPPAPPPTPAPVAPPPSRTTDLVLDGAGAYSVVKGDTLSNISRSKYKNGFYYPLIMMASNNIVEDQDLIEPGWELTIPRLQANLDDDRAKQSMKKFFLEIADITDRIRPLDAAGLRSLANSW